jgi:hypothetical protein
MTLANAVASALPAAPGTEPWYSTASWSLAWVNSIGSVFDSAGCSTGLPPALIAARFAAAVAFCALA